MAIVSYYRNASDTVQVPGFVSLGDALVPITPAAVTEFSDGYDAYGLVGNETFDPANPTLKDGTPITGSMATYHAAYTHWRDNQTTAHGYWQLTAVLGRTNAYSAARFSQPVVDAIIRSFRLTGDLRDLDLLCDGFDEMQANLDADGGNIEWDGACSVGGLIISCCSGNGNPWSPYRKINETGGGRGTDLSRLNQIKLWSLAALFTWALHLNQNKTSPGGVDYGTRLTYWKARLLEFVKAWSEDTTECWAVQNYRGVDGDYGAGTVSNREFYRHRQPWGVYPFVLRDIGHAAPNTVVLHRYVSLLGQHASLGIANAADAMASAAEMFTAIRENGYVDCTNLDHGASLVFYGNNPTRGTQSAACNTTYIGSLGGSLLDLWLTGAWRDTFTTADMMKVGSAISWAHDGTTGATYADIIRETAQCGVTVGSGSPPDAEGNSLRGFAVLPLVFRPSGTKMGDIGANLMTLSGGSTADRAAIPSALFVREAMLALGEVT